MATKKSKEAMAFIVTQLKRNPKVAYADVAKRAAKKRLTVYPIMYGRAQLLLGMVSPKNKKKRKAKAKRGPGRPRKKTGRGRRSAKMANPLSAVQDLVSNLEQHARENATLRKTLEQVKNLIDRIV